MLEYYQLYQKNRLNLNLPPLKIIRILKKMNEQEKINNSSSYTKTIESEN
jgi:hypothetical protein